MAVTAFEPHYRYHSAWVARIVAETRPARPVDIASTLHFCMMVSAVVPVESYDIRPAQITSSNPECKRGHLIALKFADGCWWFEK